MDNKTISILLGAGKPKRGRSLSALQKIDKHQSVIDRMLNILHPVSSEIIFVGGYSIDSLMNNYPELTFYNNNLWESTGSLYSLSLVNIDETATYLISYTDIVFTSHIVKSLLNSEARIGLAADNHPYERYEERSQLDIKDGGFLSVSADSCFTVDNFDSIEGKLIEVVGILKIPGSVLKQIPAILESRPEAKNWHLDSLVAYLRSQGQDIDIIDASGQWAELDAPQDLANFALSSKAKTLSRLYGATQKSKVLPQVSFSVNSWNNNSQAVVDKIAGSIKEGPLVVRSSSSQEDCWDSSCAGAFLSILSVENTAPAIRESVEKVIASYVDLGSDDEVLVQPMLKDVAAAGVIMTRTLSCGAPYYTINYDLCGSTDTVTSGAGGDLRTCFVHNSCTSLPADTPKELDQLLPAISEIIKISGHDSLDIEFGIGSDFSVYILQVRPITIDHSAWKLDDEDINKAIYLGQDRFKELHQNPVLCGTKTILSNMADWNPAEIIGIAPRQLSYSLYRFLITDDVWARQRKEFGYRDIRPTPLISLIAGHPYVNVQASFSSFIPNELPKSLADKLVDFYLNKLESNPHFHDKIEFEIVHTCLHPKFKEDSKELLENEFTESEIELLQDALRNINKNGFEIINEALASIEKLTKEFEQFKTADIPNLDKAFQLLHSCKEFGTLAFSHLARMGFVAVTFLRAMVAENILSENELEDFFRSLQTVAKSLSVDYYNVSVDKMSYEELVEKYGHLRPGTYDINSPCYSTAPDKYFPRYSMQDLSTPPSSDKSFSFSKDVTEYLTANAESYGFPINADAITEFFKLSIEGREYSKFLFTRNLSMALELIADFAEETGLDRSEISNVSIYDLQSVLVGQCGANIKKWLKQRASEGKTLHQVAQAAELPGLILSPADILAFHLGQSQPNYVGNGQCTAEIIRLTSEDSTDVDINGKIVLIEQADPGYDWLFGQQITGLITCFGGANSHMAIRAAELSLPAAIGVGEQLYKSLSGASIVKLDCSSRILEILKCA